LKVFLPKTFKTVVYNAIMMYNMIYCTFIP